MQHACARRHEDHSDGRDTRKLHADADAIVVALKTRTIDPGAAINESLEALRWLRDAGCRQFFFKYCSTFDSTPKGNIAR